MTLVRFCTERPKSAETAAEPAGSREDYSWPLLTPDMLHAADGIVVGEVDGCADLRYSQITPQALWRIDNCKLPPSTGCGLLAARKAPTQPEPRCVRRYVRRGSVKISSSLRLLLATSGTLLGKVGAAFSDNSLGDTSPVAQRWLAFFRDQRMVVSEPHMTDYTTVLDELPAATKTATLAAAKSVGAVHTTPATRDRRSAVAKVHSPVATRDPAASQDSAAMRLQGRLAALMARAVARRASQDSLLSQTAKDETVGDLDVLSVWKVGTQCTLALSGTRRSCSAHALRPVSVSPAPPLWYSDYARPRRHGAAACVGTISLAPCCAPRAGAAAAREREPRGAREAA